MEDMRGRHYRAGQYNTVWNFLMCVRSLVIHTVLYFLIVCLSTVRFSSAYSFISFFTSSLFINNFTKVEHTILSHHPHAGGIVNLYFNIIAFSYLFLFLCNNYISYNPVDTLTSFFSEFIYVTILSYYVFSSS